MKELLIGHEREQQLLREYIATERSEFIAVYGRRRVGKTFLVRQTIGDELCFSIAGLENATKQQQLANFNMTLQQYYPQAKFCDNWLEAFYELRHYLDSLNIPRKVIFLDELPWFEAQKSGFVSALENFWNAWASARTDIKLIVCGSAASWMLDNIINNHGGLYNRVTHQMMIEPFNLHDCKEYFTAYGFGYSEREIAECYMVFGGIPYHFSLMRTDESVTQNIDRLIFSPTGELRNEKINLFRSLFRHSEDYIAIIDALSEKNKGLNRNELIEATGLNNNARLTKKLDELEQCRFIRKYDSYDKHRRQTLYQLIDPFVHFINKIATKNQHQDSEFWSHSQNTPLFNTWSGLAFEMLCLNHVPQIKQALGISGIQSSVYSWRSPKDASDKVQIDLLIDRADRCVNLCEMKYCYKEYEMSKQERERIEDRLHSFMQHAEPRKSIRMTMITSFGVMRNSNSYIVQNEVTLADLFK